MCLKANLDLPGILTVDGRTWCGFGVGQSCMASQWRTQFQNWTNRSARDNCWWFTCSIWLDKSRRTQNVDWNRQGDCLWLTCSIWLDKSRRETLFLHKTTQKMQIESATCFHLQTQSLFGETLEHANNPSKNQHRRQTTICFDIGHSKLWSRHANTIFNGWELLCPATDLQGSQSNELAVRTTSHAFDIGGCNNVCMHSMAVCMFKGSNNGKVQNFKATMDPRPCEVKSFITLVRNQIHMTSVLQPKFPMLLLFQKQIIIWQRTPSDVFKSTPTKNMPGVPKKAPQSGSNVSLCGHRLQCRMCAKCPPPRTEDPIESLAKQSSWHVKLSHAPTSAMFVSIMCNSKCSEDEQKVIVCLLFSNQQSQKQMSPQSIIHFCFCQWFIVSQTKRCWCASFFCDFHLCFAKAENAVLSGKHVVCKNCTVLRSFLSADKKTVKAEAKWIAVDSTRVQTRQCSTCCNLPPFCLALRFLTCESTCVMHCQLDLGTACWSPCKNQLLRHPNVMVFNVTNLSSFPPVEGNQSFCICLHVHCDPWPNFCRKCQPTTNNWTMIQWDQCLTFQLWNFT